MCWDVGLDRPYKSSNFSTSTVDTAGSFSGVSGCCTVARASHLSLGIKMSEMGSTHGIMELEHPSEAVTPRIQTCQALCMFRSGCKMDDVCEKPSRSRRGWQMPEASLQNSATCRSLDVSGSASAGFCNIGVALVSEHPGNTVSGARNDKHRLSKPSHPRSTN